MLPLYGDVYEYWKDCIFKRTNALILIDIVHYCTLYIHSCITSTSWHHYLNQDHWLRIILLCSGMFRDQFFITCWFVFANMQLLVCIRKGPVHQNSVTIVNWTKIINLYWRRNLLDSSNRYHSRSGLSNSMDSVQQYLPVTKGIVIHFPWF